MVPWYGALQLNIDYKKIHRAVRNVLNDKFNAPSTPIYKQLGIPKFNDIAKIKMCKLMYSYNIGSIPESMKSLFVRNSSIHSYNTRHSNGNINSINYFSSKVKKYYISLYWEYTLVMIIPHRYIICQHVIFNFNLLHFICLCTICNTVALDWATDNLLDPLELKIFDLSLAYLGNAHVQIILSLA